MRFPPSLLLLAVIVGAPACASPAADIPPGTYRWHIAAPDGDIVSELVCDARSGCTETATIPTVNGPQVQTHALPHVTRFDKVPPGPAGALQVAVAERDKPAQAPDLALLQKLLQPMLAARPEVTGCWDLDDPTPEVTLACTIRERGSSASRLYMFYALVADCHDGMGFCEYVIVPLEWIPPPPPPVAPTRWHFTFGEGLAATLTGENAHGDALSVTCDQGRPKTCAWRLSTAARCDAAETVVGLVTSPAGKFRVLAHCVAPPAGQRLASFRLDDRLDIERSLARGGDWELSLPIDGATRSLWFDVSGQSNSLLQIDGCRAYWAPYCTRDLPAELHTP